MRQKDDDFDREIGSHLDLETERLIEEGMPPEDARAEARRRFGNVTSVREHFYEAHRRLWLDHLSQDVRCAIRNIRRYPIAAIVAVLSLAAGIGATTVTLTIRDVVFRKAPPTYADPGQLSRVQVGSPNRPIRPIGSHVPAALYAIWSDTLGPAIGASTVPRGVRDVRTADRTEMAPVRAVTPEFFSILGVSPALGYGLSTPAGSGAMPILLSHRLWQRLFDGSSDVAGRIVWIDDQPHTVAGVLPERFWFSEMNSPIWTALDRPRLDADAPLEVIVRRPQGMTPAMLDARLQRGLTDYARSLPAGQRDLRLLVSGVEGTPVGRQVAFILPYVLGTSVLLTLLIACANVAILMIAQWTSREHEIAIRASIGASRGRIVRALLTESVLVALSAGALGVCATFALRGWVFRRGGADATFFDLSIDPGVLVQTAVIAALTGMAAGIAPALYETRRLHTNPLRTIATSDRVRQRWRHALVVFEITVTVSLLVETVAMVDGYRRVRTAELGFSTAPLLSARVENPAGIATSQILELVNQLPGVAVAAASTMVPYSAVGRQERVVSDLSGEEVVAERGAISPEFFSALGVPLRAGRPFSDQDSEDARVSLINETLARTLFKGQDPLRGRIRIGQTSYDVVGVVADYASDPLQARHIEPRVFLPLPRSSTAVTRVQLLVRAEGDPAPLVQTIRREVRDASTGTVVTIAFTFDQIIGVMGQEMLVGTAPLFPLIAIGMLLTTAGIYGTLTFAITRRSRELAVRAAIGASGRDLVRLVTTATVRLVAMGSILGIAVTFALARVVRAAGGAGSVFDPPISAFVAPIVIVVAIGALATWVPSRRASKIDPATLLRTT
jgi:putative ABC transport system permease protein